MNMAPQELEKSASQFATDAIKYDSQGARGMAVTHYQKAIDSLLKLMHLYPDSKLNKIYTERMKSYKTRIESLQTTGSDIEPAVDPTASPQTQQENLSKRTQDNFNDMVMREKPDVKWIDVVGVDDAKNALRIGGEVRSRNQFLTEMDGINGKGKDAKLYVIGATNKPWSLDHPFLRRFQKRIYVSLPSVEAREKLFSLYTSQLKLDSRVRLHTLASIFDGYSASDIKDICQAVQLKVVNEMFHSSQYKEPIDGETPSQPGDIGMKLY